MNFADYKKKSQAVKEEKIRVSGLMYRLHRRISVVLSWFLVSLFPRLSPNVVSGANVLLVWIILLITLGADSENAGTILIIQLLLLNFTAIMDKIDGEIARWQENFSQRGIYFDIAYHFFYPFVFYFSVGYYFYLFFPSRALLILAAFLGILATNFRMFGKIRHHIRYKILLEHHENQIRDFIIKAPKTGKRKNRLISAWNYFFFFIYDWAWTFYFILTLFSFAYPELALRIYLVHGAALIFMYSFHIMHLIPQRRLYAKEEF